MPEAPERHLDGRPRPGFELPDTEGGTQSLEAEGSAPRWSCSRATTVPTRSPGTTGSPRSRATTRTVGCGCSRSAPTTRSGSRPTRSRRCSSVCARTVAGPCRTSTTNAGGRARLRRRDDSGRVRRRLRREPALPRRPRPRLRRPVGERRMAARRARRGARRLGPRPGRDQAGRVQDQMEAVVQSRFRLGGNLRLARHYETVSASVTMRSCSIRWAAGYPSPGLARYSRPM